MVHTLLAGAARRPAPLVGARRHARTAAGVAALAMTATMTFALPAAADDEVPVVPPITAPETVTVVGDARVGSTLTVADDAWVPTDVSLSYQWFAGDDAIADETASTLTVEPAELGEHLHVEVTGTLTESPDVTPVTAESVPTDAVVEGILGTTVPTISGDLTVGSTLTAATSPWTPDATLTYQWSRGGAPVDGATNATYTLTAADLGASISVTTAGSAAGYENASATSIATGAVTEGTLLAPTPKISGTAAVGSTLTAVPGTWTPGTTLAYQWSVGGATVSGATAATFATPTTALGKTVTVTVTGTLAGYTTRSATSSAVTIGSRAFTTAPTPKISGTVRVGSTLKVTTGTWSPAASLGYQWKANNVAIKGATKTSLVLTSAERGKVITVTVTGAKSTYTTTARTSAKTAAVAYGVLSGATPRISGTPAIGRTLTASAGTWSPTATLRYQWKADGRSISGATHSTYKVTSSRFGKRITVTVTGSRSGYTTTSRTSAATAKVTKVFTRTSAPRITGTTRVGSTLKATTSAWSPSASFSYQWKANGVAIKGATHSTYKLSTATHGRAISVTVTGHRSGYLTSTRTSASTVKVAWPVGVTTPKITTQPKGKIVTSGTKVSFTVKATGGQLHYQWQVSTDGKTYRNLSGHTSSTLTFTARTAHYGNKYRVVVSNMTGSKTSSGASLFANSTRSDPFRPGDAFILDNWGMVFSDATTVVTEGSASGTLAPVFVCYYGSGAAYPWLDLDVEFIGNNGKTYDEDDLFLDGDIWDTSAVYSDGCDGFVAVALVPTSAVRGGVWVITDDSDFNGVKQYVAMS